MRMVLAFLLTAVLPAADRKIVINAVDSHNRWAFTDDALRDYRTAGPNTAIVLAKSPADMAREIVDADAAFGTLQPDLLRLASKLKWLQAPAIAPPPGYYLPHPIYGRRWHHEDDDN